MRRYGWWRRSEEKARGEGATGQGPVAIAAKVSAAQVQQACEVMAMGERQCPKCSEPALPADTQCMSCGEALTPFPTGSPPKKKAKISSGYTPAHAKAPVRKWWQFELVTIDRDDFSMGARLGAFVGMIVAPGLFGLRSLDLGVILVWAIIGAVVGAVLGGFAWNIIAALLEKDEPPAD